MFAAEQGGAGEGLAATKRERRRRKKKEMDELFDKRVLAPPPSHLHPFCFTACGSAATLWNETLPSPVARRRLHGN